MNTLVLYDSVFGNTAQVARAIASALEPNGPVTILRVTDNFKDLLTGLDLLVVGSPTRGFRPTPATTKVLKNLPKGALSGVKVAAFDTRIRTEEVKSGFLHFMVRLFGYAAQPIEKQLKAKGGAPVLPPEGFFVEGTEGPLKPGELERAKQWGASLAQG
jgi:flavodoxin I